MKPLFVAVLLAAACGAAQASPGTGPVYANGKIYALVSVASHKTECTNAGGEHYSLTVANAAARDPHRVHFGGHASYVALYRGDRFVAEIRATPHTDEHPGDRRPILGPCADDPRTIDGEVLRMVEVADDADGATRLAQIAKAGWTDDPDADLAPYTPSSRGISVAHGEQRDGKLVLVVDPWDQLTAIMGESALPAGTMLDAPSGVTAGTTYVVVVRSPVRDSKPPAWHVTRAVPTTKAKAADVANAMTLRAM